MPPEGSDLVFDPRHNAEMSMSSVRISMHAVAYSLALFDLADDHGAAFPSF
jgi:hypothetical protein